MPINLQVSSEVELPFELINDGNIKLLFRRFETTEKSKLLGLKNLEIAGTQFTYERGFHQPSDDDIQDVIYTNNCFELGCPQTERDSNMSFASSQMLLIRRICLLIFATRTECSFSFKNDGVLNATRRPGFRYRPCRKPFEFNCENIDLFLKTYNEINKLQKKERFEQLISLYELAQVSSNPQGLKGSLFVTILENLFSTKDEKSELSSLLSGIEIAVAWKTRNICPRKTRMIRKLGKIFFNPAIHQNFFVLLVFSWAKISQITKDFSASKNCAAQ